jgi:hypothetical protein
MLPLGVGEELGGPLWPFEREKLQVGRDSARTALFAASAAHVEGQDAVLRAEQTHNVPNVGFTQGGIGSQSAAEE